uniref:Uncharacterized protein n=1 Tax=Oryza sativa subsp. japonica TaxID=39947 RepID=Q6ZHD1_ORYSJ|nr:hypothetical protein [Oryza sativa Japonica Group]BAD27879.1 hypothetical protein [Oryza sativa Japonica Group]
MRPQRPTALVWTGPVAKIAGADADEIERGHGGLQAGYGFGSIRIAGIRAPRRRPPPPPRIHPRIARDVDGGGGHGTSTTEASSGGSGGVRASTSAGGGTGGDSTSSAAPAACGRARVREEAPAATARAQRLRFSPLPSCPHAPPPPLV